MAELWMKKELLTAFVLCVSIILLYFCKYSYSFPVAYHTSTFCIFYITYYPLSVMGKWLYG